MRLRNAVARDVVALPAPRGKHAMIAPPHSFKRIRLLRLLALALPLGFLLGEVWGVRFTTFDDAYFALQTQPSERSAQAWHLASQSGRGFFLYYMPFLYFCIANWQTPVYDVIQYGSFTAAFMIVTYVASKCVSWRFAFGFAIFYIGTLALKWDHTLITSNPLFLHLHTILLCLSILCLQRYVRVGLARWQVLSLALLSLSLVGIEFQAVIAPAIYLFAARAALTSEDMPGDAANHRKFVRLAAMVGAIVALYLLASVSWRSHFGSDYGGVTPNLTSFDWRAALGILAKWTFSGNIFFHWFSGPTITFAPSDVWLETGSALVVPVSLFSDISFVAAVIGFGVAAGFASIFTRADAPGPSEISLPHWRWLPLAFLVVAITPSAFLSVTTKYQHWYSLGVQSYAYTSISAYGVALLFSWLFLTLMAVIRSRAGQLVLVLTTSAFLGLGATTNAMHTQQVARDMQDATARWRSIDLLLGSSLRGKVDNAVLVAPRLGSYYWSVPTKEGYWEHFARASFGAKLAVKYGAGDIDWSRPVYYFDFFRSERNGEVAIVLVPITRANGVMRLAREGWVAAKQPLRAYLTSRSASGKRSRAFVPHFDKVDDRHASIYAATFLEEPEYAEVALEDRLMWAPMRHGGTKKGYWIDFSRGGNSIAYKTGGWSGQESQHTWTIGRESGLEFRPEAEAVCDLEVELDIAGFVPPGRSSQRLEVLVNGEVVWHGAVGQRNRIRFDVPMRAWNAKRPVQMRFLHPEASSPARSLGQPDDRVLGIAFFQLALTECGSRRQ